MVLRKATAVLLLGERGAISDAARGYAERLFDVRALGRYPRHPEALGDSVVGQIRGGVDYLFNFLSPFVIPADLLAAVRKAAINFHPAPPAHPGVGSASYALYQGDVEFGATAHMMIPSVDAGPIVRVLRFPIRADETCQALFDRGIEGAFELFRVLLEEIAKTGVAPTPNGEVWARRPTTRREFERWMIVDSSAGPDEVARKVRALRHPTFPGPFVEVGGYRFGLVADAPVKVTPATPRPPRSRIPWWEPQMTGLEIAAIKEVIDANYLNEGDVTERFERELARRLGVAHVIASTSGTAAIFMALAALGLQPGDEVVVPDLTFIATANAVRLAGATPILADIDPVTLNLDPAALTRAITPRTKAIVPVHVSGRGADMEAIMEIASSRGLAVIEDAAEAFMSEQRGRRLGTIGIAGCFSFSPNKTITTGQGGAIATNDPNVAARLRELKDQGRPVRGTGGDDLHPTLGFNFKFTNVQAAIGLAQLTRLDERLERQRAIYRAYARVLTDLPGVRLPGFSIEAGEIPQWTDAIVERRDEFDHYLAQHDAGCRRFWLPIHTQTPYRRSDADFPVATRMASKAIWLPSAFTLNDDEIDRACTLIRGFFTSVKAGALVH